MQPDGRQFDRVLVPVMDLLVKDHFPAHRQFAVFDFHLLAGGSPDLMSPVPDDCVHHSTSSKIFSDT